MHHEVTEWPQTSNILLSVIAMSCTMKLQSDLRQVTYCCQLLPCHALWSYRVTSDKWHIAVSYCHVMHHEVTEGPQTNNISLSVIAVSCTMKCCQLLLCHAPRGDTATSGKWYIAASYCCVMHHEVIHWPQASNILLSVVAMACTLKWYSDLRQVT